LLGVALDGELRALSLCHVGLEANVVCHLVVVVAERRDVDAVPELLAVLPVVQYLHGDRLVGVDSCRHPTYGVRVGPLALQEPTVRPQRLRAVVAGHLLERLVDVHERVVRQLRVAHRHPDGRLLQHALFQVCRHVAVDVDTSR
jgi:hypothetical protein